MTVQFNVPKVTEPVGRFPVTNGAGQSLVLTDPGVYTLTCPVPWNHAATDGGSATAVDSGAGETITVITPVTLWVKLTQPGTVESIEVDFTPGGVDSVGNVAGGVDSDAHHNTKVGTGALASVTSGADNTVAGKDAGTGLTTGARNTLVGLSAGYSLGNSNDNTAIGYGAMSNAGANSVRNTVVGGGTATNLNGGIDNTIVGQAAGNEIVAGTGNVLLGKAAGAGLGDVSNTCEIKFGNGQAIRFTIDEAGNKLHIDVRYAGATVKSADVALA